MIRSTVEHLKTYLEIQVPIRYEDTWFRELRSRFSNSPVRWQKGYYHITMAFINETPKGIDMRPILERHLSSAVAPRVVFDRLDAFSINQGKYIIHLATSHVPEEFLSLTESIRADMKDVGCVIYSDFLLHVTLGRIYSSDVELSDIMEVLDKITMPPITLTLTDMDYRLYRGRTLFETRLNDGKSRRDV